MIYPLKYPVVLVHGIIAHDRKGRIDFWGRIPQKLKERGCEVFFGNTDALGDYESNAEILKKEIEEILRETNQEKVNIIAHSKGGIDSRYLIWKYNFGDKVASLTTIATPHHGAELADLLYKQGAIHANAVTGVLDTLGELSGDKNLTPYISNQVTTTVREALGIFGKFYGDKNPNLFKLNYQLTTENMKQFNETVEMDPRVYYQSMYTTMTNSFDELMFFYTHWYIDKISGRNDGVVSKKSAEWGNNIIEIKGGISHIEIIDYKKRKISGIDIPSIYVKIVNELGKKGF
jgi:triacylglycerol lipase